MIGTYHYTSFEKLSIAVFLLDPHIYSEHGVIKQV
jgi:hypothetical protein